MIALNKLLIDHLKFLNVYLEPVLFVVDDVIKYWETVEYVKTVLSM